MKKAFWIAYGVIFFVVVVGGLLMQRNVANENRDLKGKYTEKKELINEILAKIDKHEIPNKIWPDVYRERLGEYKDIEADLRSRFEQYNVRIKTPFPGTIEMFHGEFTKRWLPLLEKLLKNGFEVLDNTVTLATLRERFDSGDLTRELGIPMDWVVNNTVYTPSADQRKIAEEQYWVQTKLIHHFFNAETRNGDWNKYIYRRREEGTKEGGEGEERAGFPPRRTFSGSRDETAQNVPAPGLLSIVFQRPAGLIGGVDYRDSGVGYIVSKEFTDEYYFTAQFRIRFTSINALVNNMLRDNEFFFVIDSLRVESIKTSGEYEKLGRKFKGDLVPETEPPVELTMEGRVLLFDFDRLLQEKKASTPDKKKKGGKKRPGTRR